MGEKVVVFRLVRGWWSEGSLQRLLLPTWLLLKDFLSCLKCFLWSGYH